MRKIPDINDQEILTAEEFRTMLKVSRGTFDKLLRNERLPKSLSLGPRTRRWSKAVVIAWINELGVSA